MNKALKRKVNNISMPAEIHRDEWLMLFCIHLIFKSTALLQKVVSRSEWHSKRAEINYKNCVALFFGWECWAGCTQAAVLCFSCLHSNLGVVWWRIYSHGFVFSHLLLCFCPSSRIPVGSKASDSQQSSFAPAVPEKPHPPWGGCGALTLWQASFTLRLCKSNNIWQHNDNQ